MTGLRRQKAASKLYVSHLICIIYQSPVAASYLYHILVTRSRILPAASCQDLARCLAPCELDRTPTAPLRQSSSLDCGSEQCVRLESTDIHCEARSTTATAEV